MNIAIVSLSIIASAAVSLGSAAPLLIPDLVSLPAMDDWWVNHAATMSSGPLLAKQMFQHNKYDIMYHILYLPV